MTDTTSPREALTARLAQLTAREAGIQKHLRGEDGRNDADFSDRVAYTEMDEVLEGLDDSARAEIDAIRAALGRLDDGTYGICLSCGDAIQPGRLAAMPHVALCVDCAS